MEENFENLDDFDMGEFTVFDELNETFFRLCCRIDEYSSMMPPKIVNYMAEKLFEQYKTAYSILADRKSIKDGELLFKLKAQKSELVPWKFLFFHNTAGKITSKELKKEFNKLFAERKEKLKKK